MTQHFHTLIRLNIICLPLIDLTLLMWFYNYYSFKLSHKNYTLLSLKPLFSNLTFVYFWDVVSHHLHLLPQYHQSHLHPACLFASHLCWLPHILLQVPLIHQLDYHLWHNVSFDTMSNDLEMYSIHHLAGVPWRTWASLGNTLIHDPPLPNLLRHFPLPTWYLDFFYDALHYASPHQSWSLPWSAILFFGVFININ